MLITHGNRVSAENTEVFPPNSRTSTQNRPAIRALSRKTMQQWTPANRTGAVIPVGGAFPPIALENELGFTNQRNCRPHFHYSPMYSSLINMLIKYFQRNFAPYRAAIADKIRACLRLWHWSARNVVTPRFFCLLFINQLAIDPGRTFDSHISRETYPASS